MRNMDMSSFVSLVRSSAPYINAHRGKTFVIGFSGKLVASDAFAHVVHDLTLLHSLGINLVLVHGARAQIAEKVAAAGAEISYVNGLRITDELALTCAKEANGSVRVEIEAQFSRGLPNSPMAGAHLQLASGNYVTAKPLGVRDGVDYQFTGEVRKIASDAIQQRLADDDIVLLSSIGYSPSGQVFNLSAEEVAAETAIALQADKLILLCDTGVTNAEYALSDVGELLNDINTSTEMAVHLHSAQLACSKGIKRTHIVESENDGALLKELFTRDGSGILVSADNYDAIRPATVNDISGMLAMIEPLEAEGLLVPRSREQLELAIAQFVVVERDGMIVGCAAQQECDDAGFTELACFAIHEDYQGAGRAEALLTYIERDALAQGFSSLFVLTTRSTHWFQEHGFILAEIEDLPVSRQAMYNWQRNSKVLVKTLLANTSE